MGDKLPDMVAPTLNEAFILAALEKYQRDTKSPGWLARICWHAGVVQAIDTTDRAATPSPDAGLREATLADIEGLIFALEDTDTRFNSPAAYRLLREAIKKLTLAASASAPAADAHRCTCCVENADAHRMLDNEGVECGLTSKEPRTIPYRLGLLLETIEATAERPAGTPAIESQVPKAVGDKFLIYDGEKCWLAQALSQLDDASAGATTVTAPATPGETPPASATTLTTEQKNELLDLASWCEKAADSRCCKDCDARWLHRATTLREIAAAQLDFGVGELPAFDVDWAIKAECKRCRESYPQRHDKADYIPNFGNVERGDWTHTWTQEHDWRFCQAARIHEALYAARAARK